MKLAGKIVIKVLIFIFVTTLLLLSIGPFVWVVLSSFKGNAEILSSTWGYKNGLYFLNYVKAFQIAPIARYYVNSILVGFFTVLLNLTISSLAAYILARFRFKGRNFFQMIFVLALLIPGAALLQPLYISMNKLGLYDTIWALVIVYAGFGLPTSIFIMTNYFVTIPKELDEAACIDGAGFLKTFLKIIVPIAKPAFATAGIFEFLLSWNEFQFAITLTQTDKARTLPVALYYFKSAFASDYGALFAAVIIVTIPSIVIFTIAQEQVVNGLVAGSVKG
jgi:raffinose/stachyose/melibiose transport system permease protein